MGNGLRKGLRNNGAELKWRGKENEKATRAYAKIRKKLVGEYMIHFSNQNALAFLRTHEFEYIQDQLDLAKRYLLEQTGPGSDFLGWVNWPVEHDQEELARVKLAAEQIRKDSDVLVVIGIGGSYLGSRAVIEALGHPFSAQLSKEERQAPQVIYAGHQLSATYLEQLVALLDRYEVSLNVISKSGTTTEPAIAFRVLKTYMEKRYGLEEARRRIYCTTDKARGALKKLAQEEGYEQFVVPDNIGGRYSVLTAVGLLPIAVAGIDVDAMMAGAKAARERYQNASFEENDALRYAATRLLLHRRQYEIELLVNYEPALHFISEWWKQLYGESEGKDGKGLFPASVDNTSDLHSMGQYVQDGKRHLFETVLRVKKLASDFAVPNDPQNLDGLNFLSGMALSEINDRAIDGTILAHVDGGVPNLELSLDELDAYHLGELVYFFEYACGLSGYLNAVNPFDQPGVEAYKRNMFALLGKPGYEKEKAELEARLKSR